MKNVAYWVTSSHIDNNMIVNQIAGTGDWTDYIFSENGIPALTDEIIDTLKKMISGINGRYIVITDNDDFCRKLKTHFISNNIFKIDNINNYSEKGRLRDQIEWVLSDFGKDRVTDDNNIFFCSDLHFNHGNIIKYCNRPWNSGRDENGNIIVTDNDIVRMNEDLIANWNSVVKKNSKVFFLGDFCLGQNQSKTIPEFVSRLNGRITLILGNHDNHNIKFYYDAGFAEVYKYPIIWNQFYILSHAPVQWIKNGSVYFNCCGHIHNQELYRSVTANTYNCCVEVNDYKPVSFADIKRKARIYS